ncbi:SAM-dependent methyltransferase [Actinomadura harenae]|uniref:SAM-dependent methyltransferase n=1 Tax=Actinomadura harenae TaxID=2483351 RepID=A0A3M2M075_9ACTN|nr:SAM-dependent methyltransferase [Actinomadura harenae]RMI42832.1 SAM-dependent methyltransferase [Actinomadura harenae]
MEHDGRSPDGSDGERRTDDAERRVGDAERRPGAARSAHPSIDPEVPHSARIWNHWLGGKDNYAADRAAGDKVRAVYPAIVDVARQSRLFLGRAVRHLVAEEGVTQFLDVGTGLPTADNTHEVAQRLAPRSRIVYVDNDPLVLVHARALLTSTPEGACAYIDADARDPERILARAADTLDFTRPVALMMLGILGSIWDDGEAMAVRDHLVDALPPGSHLVLEDGTGAVDPDAAADAEHVRAEAGDPYKLRSPEGLAEFFHGLKLLDPGVVAVSRWRPDPNPWGTPPEVTAYGGVAAKP